MSSSLRLNPPFRADHIGSLKRPEALLKKRAEFDAKKCSRDELRALEDEAIREIVAMQRKAGIRSFTDGEFRRHMFYDGVFDNLDGMEFIPEVPPELFKDYVPDVAAFKKLDFKGGESYLCKGKLKRTKPFYKDQFEFLKSIVSAEELPGVKLTIAAPEWFHLRHGEHAYDQNVYKSDAEYFADIAVAYQEEIKELYSLGCRNIQFDDPLLAYFCAESMLEGMKAVGVDSEALLDTYIKAYNDCLKGRPRDMTVGLHLCRGNFKDGMHFSEGGYDRIARKLFNEIDVDTYYLEYDTQRAGTFEPLKYLPAHKSVVLGVLSSKVPALEHVEDTKRRIREAAQTIAEGEPKRSVEEALNQICLSPQCGFASHAEGNRVTSLDVERKLQLAVAIAQEIW